MKKILLTGADGLLGSNLTRRLLDQGYEVKVFRQPGRETGTLSGLDLTYYEGDLTNKEAVFEAVEGADAVIHAAAITNTVPSRGEIYWKVNMLGTQNVAEAVQHHKVARLVCVGSASSLGFGPQQAPGGEETPFVSDQYGLDYIDSKRAAHEYILTQSRENGLPAIIICPTFMIGAYDSKPSSGAMILAVVEGRVPAIPPGGKNWVFVGDVAQGIVNALTQGRLGEAYIAGHENLSYETAYKLIAEVAGVAPPKLKLPGWALNGAGKLVEGISKLTGKPPAFTYPMARVANDGHYFSPAKAVKELNLPQTGLRHGIEQALAWFKDNGYIK